MTLQTTRDIDLTACEREPIHIPGSIQPHGVLLAVRLSDRTLAYASANIAETFGLDPSGALDRPFADILPVLSEAFEAQLADPPPPEAEAAGKALVATLRAYSDALGQILGAGGSSNDVALELSEGMNTFNEAGSRLREIEEELMRIASVCGIP